MMDPEPENGLIKTNLDIKLVAKAAKRMRVENETLQTIFRGPTAQMQLIRDNYKEDKHYG
jgi:hypothetical protein